EPPVAASLAELCSSATLLAPGEERTLRYDHAPITGTAPGAGCHGVAGGAAAVNVEIDTNDVYHFEVVRASPDGARGVPGGNTVLWLRSFCDGAASQLACNDDLDAA